MIYEHFRTIGAHEAVEGLSDLFTESLQNDDVQDFDVRCDQVLLSASDMPSDVILEGLVQVKITEFCSTPDCIGICMIKKRLETMESRTITYWWQL